MSIAAPSILDQPVDEVSVDVDRPWKVLVWDDPVNTMDYVVFVFQKLFGFGRDKATRLMLEVHHQGKSVVATGEKEKMEAHVFALHQYSLWATLEQDQ